MDMWESLGSVGEGTFGVVIKARHRETGEVVAIKKFKETDEDEHVKKIAYREIRILKQLRQANIVALLDSFKRKGRLYLIFEWVEGTVLQHLERSPYGLPPEDVKRLLYQTARSLHYCHSRQIIHRDVKPENILVSRHGAVKLCDFGFARLLLQPGARYTDYVATRWYRAPEMLVGDTEYGPPVDVWAFGCLAAELATGAPLYPGETDVDVLSLIVRCLGGVIPRHEDAFRRNTLYLGVSLPTCPDGELKPLASRVEHLRPAEYRDWLTKLLQRTLCADPAQRITFEEMLSGDLYDEDATAVLESEIAVVVQRDAAHKAAQMRRYQRARVSGGQAQVPASSQRRTSHGDVVQPTGGAAARDGAVGASQRDGGWVGTQAAQWRESDTGRPEPSPAGGSGGAVALPSFGGGTGRVVAHVQGSGGVVPPHPPPAGYGGPRGPPQQREGAADRFAAPQYEQVATGPPVTSHSAVAALSFTPSESSPAPARLPPLGGGMATSDGGGSTLPSLGRGAVSQW